jgi:hypothetical protein
VFGDLATCGGLGILMAEDEWLLLVSLLFFLLVQTLSRAHY